MISAHPGGGPCEDEESNMQDTPVMVIVIQQFMQQSPLSFDSMMPFNFEQQPCEKKDLSASQLPELPNEFMQFDLPNLGAPAAEPAEEYYDVEAQLPAPTVEQRVLVRQQPIQTQPDDNQDDEVTIPPSCVAGWYGLYLLAKNVACSHAGKLKLN